MRRKDEAQFASCMGMSAHRHSQASPRRDIAARNDEMEPSQVVILGRDPPVEPLQLAVPTVDRLQRSPQPALWRKG